MVVLVVIKLDFNFKKLKNMMLQATQCACAATSGDLDEALGRI